MIAKDFKYDTSQLSEMGFMICDFNGTGLSTIPNVGDISFEEVSVRHGNIRYMTNYNYDSVLETTIQICKLQCGDNVTMAITPQEERKIMKWLTRNSYLPLKIFGNDRYNGISFEAKISVSRIEFEKNVVGFELKVTTNRPFAIGDTITHSITANVANYEYSLQSKSDEDGSIYPSKVTIVPKANGNLSIINAYNGRETLIKNCVAGETIIMNYPIISTTWKRQIQNEFNWNFLRIENQYNNNMNYYKISLPCNITIEYNPIVKIGI